MKINAFGVSYSDGFRLSIDAMELEKGKIYCIIGANGCGKSTFIKALSGSIRTTDGSSPLPENIAVTYLPQKPYAFRMSVRKNILLGGKDTQRAQQLMSALGIEALSNRKAHLLSGGETARMALARCLMSDCDLLLLDEPTAAMDIEATILAEQEIVNACKAIGCAVMMVTHSPAQAARIADTIMFFNNGRIVESGRTAELLASAQNPETKRFLEFSGL